MGVGELGAGEWIYFYFWIKNSFLVPTNLYRRVPLVEVLYLADLLACQVWVTADDPGLCCCVPCYTCDVCRTLLWFPLSVNSTQTLRASCLVQIIIPPEAKAHMSNWKTRQSKDSEHFGSWLDTLHCLPYYNETASSHYSCGPVRMSLITHSPVIQSSILLFSWCFTSTETVWLIRDGVQHL